MKNSIKEELEFCSNNEYMQQLLSQHYQDGLKRVDNIDLIKFFDLEEDEVCELLSSYLGNFSDSFTPLFCGNDMNLIGYWIDTNSKREEDVYIVEFFSFASLVFFGKVSLIEYFALQINSAKISYKTIQKNLSKYNVAIRDKKVLENMLGHFKKVSAMYKKTELLLHNIDDICKHGRVIERDKSNISVAEYKEWMHPRFGDKNPTKVKSKVWEYGVASRKSAYSLCVDLNKKYFDEDMAKWSFDRFGKSITLLEDGTEIHIAGEHEDYYDEDFYIYNDVVVIHPDDSIDFYLYPKELFPATDFHSATLYQDSIIIIGSLGYMDEREYGKTPVYRLDLTNFQISKIETSGEMPGWIHSHKATLNGDSIVIDRGLVDIKESTPLLKNVDKWELNLKTNVWKRLTKNTTRELVFKREDNGYTTLFKYFLYIAYHKNDTKKFKMLKNDLGYEPKPEVYEKLYDFNLPNVEVIKRDDYENIEIKVSDVILEINESTRSLNVLIIGEISDKEVDVIKDTISKNLEILENRKIVVEDIIYDMQKPKG